MRIRGWAQVAGLTLAAAASRADARPTHEVLGWHPHTGDAAYVAYDWSLLSTVAFHAVELDGRGFISAANGWPDAGLVAAAHEHGVRVALGVTVPSQGEAADLLADPENRHRAVVLLLAAVLDGAADGVALDIESVPGAARDQFMDFVRELRATLRATMPGSYLALTLPGWDWQEAYDAPTLAHEVDYLALRADVCRWHNAPAAGPACPLDGWGTCSATDLVAARLAEGVPSRQILLGVPYYGYRWPTESGDPGAPTRAPGVQIRYEVAQAEAEVRGRLWDAESSTPWFRSHAGGWEQGWYDDAASLGAKYDLALGADLGGVALHFLGYDGDLPELWGALRAHFGVDALAVAGAGGRSPLLVRPNPSSGAVFWVGSAAKPGAVEIFDATGRRVRRILTEVGSATWDGRDDGGAELPGGVYLLRGPGGAARVTRLR